MSGIESPFDSRQDSDIPTNEPHPPEPTDSPKATTAVDVRQFELPPRKARLEAIDREPNEEDVDQKKGRRGKKKKKTWCICRAPEDSEDSDYMIGCDGCGGWFHGKCVGISEEAADSMNAYLCPDCTQKQLTQATKAMPKGRKTDIRCAGSKYCSEQCGYQAARAVLARLNQQERSQALVPLLPRESLLTPPQLLALQSCRVKQRTLASQLEEVQQSVDQLRDGLGRAREEATAARNPEHPNSNESLDCFSCNRQISLDSLGRHLETCFAKKELQLQVSGLEGNLIDPDLNPTCDVWDRKLQGFCKKLKVTCPLHTVPKNPAKSSACGCPTMDFGSGHCEVSRGNCSKHAGWELIRRADLELQQIVLRKEIATLKLTEARLLRQHVPAQPGGHVISVQEAGKGESAE